MFSLLSSLSERLAANVTDEGLYFRMDAIMILVIADFKKFFCATYTLIFAIQSLSIYF